MKAPRESPPPSRWGKSKAGVYFEIVGGHKRDDHGRKLYRLRYLSSPGWIEVVGAQQWTLAELIESGVRFLKHRPRVPGAK